MSFTTDNNNEKVVKDDVPKSPGRLVAEERAERIRYAQEYRRKLEAEQGALAPKKTKAAEQKEKDKLEKAEKEKAQRLLRVEEENKEAERRINEAMDKVSELAAKADEQAPVTEEVAEPIVEANEESASEPIVISVAANSAKIPVAVDYSAPAPSAAIASERITTIDVTGQFRSESAPKPIITYGRVVTEGGWEHEIDDIIRPVAVPVEVVAQSEAAVYPVVAPIPIKAAAAPVAVAAAAGAAAVNILDGAEKPAEPIAEQENKAEGYDADTYFIVDDSAAEEEAPAPAAAQNNGLYIEEGAEVARDPETLIDVSSTDADWRGAQDDEYLDDDMFSVIDGFESDENFNRFQREDAHIRYLNQTKRLDKLRNKRMSAKRYTDFGKEGIKEASKRSAALVGLRMEYDARVSTNDLKMDVLLFTDNRKYKVKEDKVSATRILNVRGSIKKAKKLEKKATKRYYSVVARETENPTIIKNIEKQERLYAVIASLKRLIKEREAIDEKLATLYKDSEARGGGKIRLRAEKKRYKKAKQVRRGLNGVYARLQFCDVPDSLRTKILHLFNTKIISESTIVYNKYLLKKLKPKGEAKSSIKRNIKRAKKSLRHLEKNLSALMYKARRYARVRRNRSLLFFILFLLLVGAGFCCYLLFMK